MANVARMSKPYRAVLKKDWEAMGKYFGENNLAMYSPLTVTKDTAIHIAVYSGEVKLLKKLLDVEAIDQEFMKLNELKNDVGNTPLHVAAAVGDVEMARLLIDKDKELLETANSRGETPLFTAAAYGRQKMVEFLDPQVHPDKKKHRKRGQVSILHVAVIGKHFKTALHLAKSDESLIELRDNNGMTCLQLLANMPPAFKSGNPMNILEKLLYLCLPDDDHETQDTSSQRQDLEGGCVRSPPRGFAISIRKIWRCIARGLPVGLPAIIGKLWEIKKQNKRAIDLANFLAKTDDSWIYRTTVGQKPETFSAISDSWEEMYKIILDKEKPQQQSTTSGNISSETPLISAARNGIIEIVDAILKLYPQAVEHVNAQGENIFHVAVRNRRKEILDLLQDSNVPWSRLTRRLKENGDSILHQAAYYSKRQLRDRPGEALLMQSEIQWFKRVRKMVPPYFINHRNTDEHKRTADELFTIEHKDLLEKGRTWIDQTTKACTIVAVLIATVAFTCAYTIPGGPNSKTGHPLLLNATSFRVFTISDTLSLCFSLTSVVVFLSIMTSRMDEQDFRRSLPLRLVLGLTTLFFSVAFMMAAFSATLVLIIRQRLHWAAIPIYSVACVPVTIFLMLQFRLYVNIAWFTVSDLLHSFLESLPSRNRSV